MSGAYATERFARSLSLDRVARSDLKLPSSLLCCYGATRRAHAGLEVRALLSLQRTSPSPPPPVRLASPRLAATLLGHTLLLSRLRARLDASPGQSARPRFNFRRPCLRPSRSFAAMHSAHPPSAFARPHRVEQNPEARTSGLRASILESALELGIGSNRTVANWIFNPVDEDEEEAEVRYARFTVSRTHRGGRVARGFLEVVILYMLGNRDFVPGRENGACSLHAFSIYSQFPQ